MDRMGRLTTLGVVIVAILLLVQLANAYPNPSPQPREQDSVVKLLRVEKRQNDTGVATVPAEADEPMAQSAYAGLDDDGDLVVSRGPVDPFQGESQSNDDDDVATLDSNNGQSNTDGPALTDNIPSPSAYAAQTDVPSTADAGGEGPVIEPKRGKPPLSGYPDITNLALPGSGSDITPVQPAKTKAPGPDVSRNQPGNTNAPGPDVSRGQPVETNAPEPDVSRGQPLQSNGPGPDVSRGQPEEDNAPGPDVSRGQPGQDNAPGPDVSRGNPAPEPTDASSSEVSRSEPEEQADAFVAIPSPAGSGQELFPSGGEPSEPAEQQEQADDDVATVDSLNMTQTTFQRYLGVQPTLRTLFKKRMVLVTSASPVIVTKIQYVIALTQANVPGAPATFPAVLRSPTDNGGNNFEIFSGNNKEYIPLFSGKPKTEESSESVPPFTGGVDNNQPATASGNMNLPILTGDWNATSTSDDYASSDWFMMHKPTNTVTITIGPHGELPSGIPPDIASAISDALNNGLTAFPWSENEGPKPTSGSSSEESSDQDSDSDSTSSSSKSSTQSDDPSPVRSTSADATASATQTGEADVTVPSDSADLPTVNLDHVQPAASDQPFRAKLESFFQMIGSILGV